MGMHALNVGSASPRFEQSPYRPARVGSGVLCPGKVALGDEIVECESPLTTRLRGGLDSEQRPLAEYLCQTCGQVFVAVTVSVDPGVRFDEVVVPDGVIAEVSRPIAVGTALRRLERTAKAGKAPKQPTPWTCEDCGAMGVGAMDLKYHRLARHDIRGPGSYRSVAEE